MADKITYAERARQESFSSAHPTLRRNQIG